ncbi:uncharacterized protein LOC119309417 [Triticum dicoccoides]|uniref:uncharacterized protein LOC119309417 n=1 Tax=Triticum dicoccoides TaxID=85692 RepID=UPI0018912F34|nr:uncharacterized protein LOC119309417 [Triticum dicoccoides]XP_044388768.1 uncharacterized protein LOC123111951 [Triticum aestivum]
MLLCLLDDARVPRMHPLLSRAPDPWLQRRDEIATPGTKTMLGFSDHVRSFVNPVWTTSLSGNDSDTTSRTGKQLDISHEKVPKLLLHRLFPNVRYSLCIDGKLKLVKDPYQLLKRFLWRKNVRFTISRYYRRFDVFEEAEANKAGSMIMLQSITK